MDNFSISIEKELFRDYEAKMCCYNKIPHLLAYKVMKKDGEYHIFYEEAMPLEKTGVLGHESYKSLLLSLGTLMLECQDYMLEPTHISFKPSHIFHKSNQWYFLYIPKENNIQLQTLIMSWVDGLEPFLDKKNRFIMSKQHQLRMALSSEQFSLRSFLKLIKEERLVN